VDGLGGDSLGAARGEIYLDASGAVRSLDTLQSGLQNIDRQAANFGSGFDQSLKSLQANINNLSQSLRNVGQNMTLAVTTPLVGMAGMVVNWASDMDESVSKVGVIFDDAADEVIAFSEGSAKALGMSQQATLDYTSSFAGMLQPLASTSEELAGMSTELTGLTSDFASFHNLSPARSFEVLQSALAGETEAIRQYGVDVSAAAVEQKALELGLGSTTAELSEQDKMLARYHLILEQTTDEQGDFANV
jgi:hypothetical protein